MTVALLVSYWVFSPAETFSLMFSPAPPLEGETDSQDSEALAVQLLLVLNTNSEEAAPASNEMDWEVPGVINPLLIGSSLVHEIMFRNPRKATNNVGIDRFMIIAN